MDILKYISEYLFIYNYHYNEHWRLNIEVFYECHSNNPLHMVLKSWANECTKWHGGLIWLHPFAFNLHKIWCNILFVYTNPKAGHFSYQNISLFLRDREGQQQSVELP